MKKPGAGFFKVPFCAGGIASAAITQCLDTASTVALERVVHKNGVDRRAFSHLRRRPNGGERQPCHGKVPETALASTPAGSGERVLPLQPWEAREIGIRGKQLAAVLNGKGRQVRIRYQVSGRLTGRQHLPKDDPVPLGRLDYSRAGLVQPALYPFKRLAQRQGVLEDPWIGPYANEC